MHRGGKVAFMIYFNAALNDFGQVGISRWLIHIRMHVCGRNPIRLGGLRCGRMPACCSEDLGRAMSPIRASGIYLGSIGDANGHCLLPFACANAKSQTRVWLICSEGD